MTGMQPKPKRPTGVTVLAILDILGGIVGLAAGALFIGIAALASSSLAAQYPSLGTISGIASILYALGALALILGIVSIIVAIGFLGGKGWAWTLGIVVSVINIVVSIVETVIGFSVIIIYYLMRPHVKAFFGKGPATAPSMQPPPMGSSTP